MRKRIIFPAILLIIYLLTAVVNGLCDDDRSYYMSRFKVNAQLNSSGDMDVTEDITYEFDGSFRGVYRTVRAAGSDGLEAFEVYKLKDGNPILLTNDNSERDNTYQLLDEGNGITVKIFSAAKDESRTFVIKYRVINAAVKYRDIGELYWQFMGKDTDVVIKNFQVNITLPEGASREQIKIFGHGPLSGISEIIDSQNVSLKIERLQPHNIVEARVLFPPSLIGASSKITDEAVLEKIMAEEKGYADKANAKRTKARAAVGFSFFYILFELLMIVYLYFKYDKEYKTEFMGRYFRELPGNYSPAVLSVLWNFGNVKPRDITATLMDLVRRKYLRLIFEQQEAAGLFKKNLKNEYVFKLNGEADMESLPSSEKYFIKWLVSKTGHDGRVSLSDIKQAAKSKKAAERFKEDYDTWTDLVKAEANELSFFDKSTLRGKIYGVVIALAGLTYGIITVVLHRNIVGFILLLAVSITLMIYSLVIRRRSRFGAEQFKMWKAFRKFLTHFSRLDKAEMPAVTLWEHYLVYAITLGVAKEVIKQLRLVFTEEDFRNSGLTYMYYGQYGHNYNHFDAIENVTNAMVKTTESVYTEAMSKMSSGSGGGGGFSSGGGGGGGGGGAGAF